MLEPSDERRRGTGRGNPAAAIAKPIAMSIAIHGVIAFAILGTAWGVTRARTEQQPPVVLTADFLNPAPTPRDISRQESPPTAADASAARATKAPDLNSKLKELERASTSSAELDGLARRFGASDAEGSTTSASARAGASFAGLVAGNATKVAYVVDASGSMIGSFPAIIDEVERSLARLEPTQQFTVFCFRRDGAEAIDGDPTLRPASRAARTQAMNWLRTKVLPSGRSSPVDALAAALRSGADCVFLLSTTVTGPGRHELDRDSLLALLDRLNPTDPTSGRRRVTIQCIQFLEPDPGAALEAVAAAHFGDGGYRFVSRSAAGFEAIDNSSGASAR